MKCIVCLEDIDLCIHLHCNCDCDECGAQIHCYHCWCEWSEEE